MFDKLIRSQRDFTEAVGGHLQRPVERILGPTVSRDTQTLIPVGTNRETQTPILARGNASSQTMTPPIPTIQGRRTEGMDIDAGVASSSRNPPPLRGSLVIPTVQGVLNRTRAGGGLAVPVRHGQMGSATVIPPRGRPRRSSLPGYSQPDDPVELVDRLNPPPAYQFGGRGAPPAYQFPAVPMTGGPLLGAPSGPIGEHSSRPPPLPRTGLSHDSLLLSRMGGRVLVNAPPQPPRWTGDMARPDPEDAFPDRGWYEQGLDDPPRRRAKRKRKDHDEGKQGRRKFRRDAHRDDTGGTGF